MINLLIFLSLSQLLLMSLALIISNNTPLFKTQAIVLNLCLLSFLLALSEYFNGFSDILKTTVIMMAGMTLSIGNLVLWDLFQRGRTVPRILIAFMVLSVILEIARISGLLEYLRINTAYLAANKFLIESIVLIVIVQGYRNDELWLKRLTARNIVVTFFVLILTLGALYFIVGGSAGNNSGIFQTIQFLFYLTILVALLSINLTMIWLDAPYFFNADDEVLIENQNEEDEFSEEAQLMLNQIKTERLYAKHHFKISDLSDELQIPVYRVRNLINNELNYRNFNSFINQFRISEAAEILKNNKKMPALTIAIEVGFKSFVSFNDAFKQRYNTTPNEWRLNPNNHSVEKQ